MEEIYTEAEAIESTPLEVSLETKIRTALFFIAFIGAIAAYPAMEEMLRNNPELQQSIHDEVMRELNDELDNVPVEMRDDIIKEALDTIPGGR